MEDNKRILLQVLVLLSCLPLLCSCVDKAVYTYEDVVITRYDCWDEWPSYKSVYYCNNSEKNCKIEIWGASNYYRALLCINRETKKVWIINGDCYIRQQEVDTIHFQGDTICYWWNAVYPKELKDIKEMIYTRNTELLEENYECYVLEGLGDYLKYEKKDSEKEYPNSKIIANYGKQGVTWWTIYYTLCGLMAFIFLMLSPF